MGDGSDAARGRVARASRPVALYALACGALTLATSTCASAATRAAGAPRGAAFALAHALALGRLSGALAERWPPTPALTAQTLAGTLLRNVPGAREAIGGAVHRDASTLARAFALGLILARAGLALDAATARRRAREVATLATIPGTLEALATTALGAAFFELPIATAFALGFLMCGISLAVVIPPAVAMKRTGLGVEAGVPDLVVAASSFDGILCIVGFGVCGGVVAASGGGGASAMAWKVPTQLVVGALGGVGAAEFATRSGLLSAPGNRASATSDASMILSVVLLILFAAKRLEVNGGGALASIAFCVAVSSAWKSRGMEDALKETTAFMNALWAEFAAPLLFVIIGCTLDLHAMTGDVAAKAIGIIALGGIVRALGVFLSTAASESMNLRERAFIALAWTPKATIQAALANVVYDQAVTAHGVGSPEALDGEKLLQTALLSILITAPLGAWCIAYFAPRLLKQETKPVAIAVA